MRNTCIEGEKNGLDMASGGQKRERDWEVSEMEEGKGVSVHGIPIYVSPVKESRRTTGVSYFEAKLSDGKKCVRVVSFEPSHRDALKKAQENKEVVKLVNSDAKKSTFSCETEVHMNKRSKVMESPLKMTLGESVPFTKAVKISEIVTLSVGQLISVTCKVVNVGEVEQVQRKSGAGKELSKQEVTIGDETGVCRMVLWEGDVDSIEEGKSYRFEDVGVRKFGGNKYLSYARTSSKEEVAELEEVNEDEVVGEESEDWGHVVTAEISSVISTAEYLSCKMCKSKALSEDGLIAECTKCSCMMKISCCGQSKSAKFIVKEESGRETTLSVFEPVLSRIVDGVDGRNLSTKLLKAPPKLYRFNDRNVVFSIQEK